MSLRTYRRSVVFCSSSWQQSRRPWGLSGGKVSSPEVPFVECLYSQAACILGREYVFPKGSPSSCICSAGSSSSPRRTQSFKEKLSVPGASLYSSKLCKPQITKSYGGYCCSASFLFQILEEDAASSVVLSTEFCGRQDLFQGKRAVLMSILVVLHHWPTGGEIIYFKAERERRNFKASFCFLSWCLTQVK